MPLRILTPRGVNAGEKIQPRGVNAGENRHAAARTVRVEKVIRPYLQAPP
jgi:hypothetical protein